MIMAGLLHDYEALLQWTIGTNTLHKGLEAFSRLFKKEGWATLKVQVTFQKGFRDEASNMLKFPDIHPNVNGFVRMHGQDFEIGARCCPVCHKVILFHSVSLPVHLIVGGEARTRGCGLPRYTRKVVLVLQRRMKDFTHIPQLRVKGCLNPRRRFCGSFSEDSKSSGPLHS